MPKKIGLFWKKTGNDSVDCCLCSHRCRIANGSFGVCKVRQNIGGELFTFAYGNVVAANIDPVEKKPLRHFLPGTATYSIAIAGCNFRCQFCQNWAISQVEGSSNHSRGKFIAPNEIVDSAVDSSCRSISYTYTEPTIFFEYAAEVGVQARKIGLKNIFVSNGFMTSEVIEKAAIFLDAANIDLKFFSEESYKRLCNGRLQPVLDTIRIMKNMGIWVEVTTLIIPGLNDSEEELVNIAEFIAETGKDIPWHVSRFHPDYHYQSGSLTPIETIEKAVEIGKASGLKQVYPGNI